MKGNGIKILVNILALLIIFFYKNNGQKNNVTDSMSEVYDIRIPGLLTGVCVLWVVLGVIFTTTMMVTSKNSNTVTKGHYYLGIAFIAIGLIGFIFSKNWKVTVSQKNIIHTSVLGITKEYSKDDITDAKLGSKKELVVRFKKGKVTIDPATTNYSRLVGELLQTDVE
ncbi:hypothetical protein [Butyrivibrio sp. AE3003]|uniref:hypothetical protein n=1 Tax=Butyrivibrio sp. AE3003 TaxID=1496721 RepID=UPI00047D50F7|nr:hypothetical protein [Butyrivibrio sp. AE3003]